MTRRLFQLTIPSLLKEDNNNSNNSNNSNNNNNVMQDDLCQHPGTKTFDYCWVGGGGGWYVPELRFGFWCEGILLAIPKAKFQIAAGGF